MYSMWTGVRSDSDRMIASVCFTCPGRLSVTAKILRDFKKTPYVDWRGHGELTFVFHLRCTQNHCSGYCLTAFSIAILYRWVLISISFRGSPVLTNGISGPERNLNLLSSLTKNAGITGAPVCLAMIASPLLAKAGRSKKSITTPLRGSEF